MLCLAVRRVWFQTFASNPSLITSSMASRYWQLNYRPSQKKTIADLQQAKINSTVLKEKAFLLACNLFQLATHEWDPRQSLFHTGSFYRKYGRNVQDFLCMPEARSRQIPCPINRKYCSSTSVFG